MVTTEKFCLRWNEFETNLRVAIQESRVEGDLYDCTLICGSRQVQAHKLVLAACSPFFRNIFKQNPHHHPLLYLKGIKLGDLQSVLTFIYYGEVSIAKEELPSFLAAAEELQVKGLTESSSSPQNTKDDPLLTSTPSSVLADTQGGQVDLPKVKIEPDQQELHHLQHSHHTDHLHHHPDGHLNHAEQALAGLEDSTLDTVEDSFGDELVDMTGYDASQSVEKELDTGYAEIDKGRE